MTESTKNLSAVPSPTSTPTQSSDGASAIVHGDGFAAGEQIRLRAYELYRERGGKVGDDMGDWLQAEREYLDLSSNGRVVRRAEDRVSDLTPPASQS
ncbi:MAG: DUF2934 domain-containing protein [bacterium]